MEISSQLAAIPGDVAGIRRISRRFEQTATSIEEAVKELKQSVLTARNFDSDAVEAVEGSVDAVSGRLDSLKGRYATAGVELDKFATELESAQSQTRGLLTQQEQWQGHLSHLQTRQSTQRMNAPTIGAPDYFSELATHREEMGRLNTAMSGAQEELRRLQSRYSNIVQDLRRAASQAAGNLRQEIRSDGLNDSAWQRFSNWVSEHADILTAIHKIMGMVTAALGVLSIFFPVLLPFAIGSALLTAGLGLVLASTGQISWVDFALDVVAVLTFGVAAVAVRGLKGVMTGLKATRVQHAVASGARSPLRSVTGSFNGLLKGSKGSRVLGIQLPSRTWGVEVFRNKGVTAAHFMRVVTRGRAGAGSAAEEAIINAGRAWHRTGTLSRLLNTVIQGSDTVGEQIPVATSMLRDVVDGGPAEAPIDAIADWADTMSEHYTDFKESWRVGN